MSTSPDHTSHDGLLCTSNSSANLPTTTTLYNFSLTHPKNYFGTAIAVMLEDPVEIIVPKELVKMAGEATQGAEALGLITRHKELTPLGSQFIDSVKDSYQTLNDGFHAIAESKTGRFIDKVPELQTQIQIIFVTHASVTEIIKHLSTENRMSLAELAQTIHQSGSDNLANWLFNTESHGNPDNNGSNIDTTLPDVTLPGSDTSTLDPTTDIWKLSPELEADLKQEALNTPLEEVWE